MNYIITGISYNGKLCEQPDNDTIVMSGEELGKSNVRFTKEDKIYVPSESSLSTVMEHMDDESLKAGISRLKDKYLCREALKPLYPDFFFATAQLGDLANFNTKGKKIVIKPRKGFFGTGVRIVEVHSDLAEVAREIKREVLENARYFPDSILRREEFILEEFISGEEFAVDMFYDQEGVPAIMNIYSHPEAANSSYDHLMYYNNKAVFERYLKPLTRLFIKLGDALNLKSFPIHAEFKLQNDNFVPIEFNPMRYGGFGLADLTKLSYGFDPISCYFTDQHLNWAEIWRDRDKSHYAFILAYNGTEADVDTMCPDHAKLQACLKENANLLDYIQLDHTQNPVFAIAYIHSHSKKDMLNLLNMEFNDFFI